MSSILYSSSSSPSDSSPSWWGRWVWVARETSSCRRLVQNLTSSWSIRLASF